MLTSNIRLINFKKIKKKIFKNKLKKFKKINPKINRLFAFKRTDISYHCVEKSNENRIVLILNYNYKNRYFNEK